MNEVVTGPENEKEWNIYARVGLLLLTYTLKYMISRSEWADMMVRTSLNKRAKSDPNQPEPNESSTQLKKQSQRIKEA